MLPTITLNDIYNSPEVLPVTEWVDSITEVLGYQPDFSEEIPFEILVKAKGPIAPLVFFEGAALDYACSIAISRSNRYMFSNYVHSIIHRILSGGPLTREIDCLEQMFIEENFSNGITSLLRRLVEIREVPTQRQAVELAERLTLDCYKNIHWAYENIFQAVWLPQKVSMGLLKNLGACHVTGDLYQKAQAKFGLFSSFDWHSPIHIMDLQDLVSWSDVSWFVRVLPWKYKSQLLTRIKSKCFEWADDDKLPEAVETADFMHAEPMSYAHYLATGRVSHAFYCLESMYRLHKRLTPDLEAMGIEHCKNWVITQILEVVMHIEPEEFLKNVQDTLPKGWEMVIDRTVQTYSYRAEISQGEYSMDIEYFIKRTGEFLPGEYRVTANGITEVGRVLKTLVSRHKELAISNYNRAYKLALAYGMEE